MQRPKDPNKRTPLSSKIREFWILHPNVLIIIVCAVFFVLAVAILCVVGICQNWDFHGILMSPTAILVYVLVGFAVVVYICQRFIFKRW